MEKEHNQTDEEKMNLFRRRCSSEAVFIDTWCPGIDESKVPEEELLPGEIEAVTFQVRVISGCLHIFAVPMQNRISVLLNM